MVVRRPGRRGDRGEPRRAGRGGRLILDGGTATSLQALYGFDPYRPVEDWLVDHPERIEDVHRRFVDAGAEVVLAATFRSLPSLRADWEDLAARAVAIARRAAGGRAQVWASIGSGAPAGDVAALACHAVDRGADGVVLETFTDPEELVRAVVAVRGLLPDVPLASSLAPREDGALFSGDEPAPWLLRLRDAGATVVGFNCGFGPASIEAAFARSADVAGPLWAKPGAGDASPAALLAALRRLSLRCEYVGGCCGVSAETIAALGHSG